MCFLCVQGGNSFAPLTGISKKQICVSHSTPEAEIVAADHAVRIEGLPALQLWEAILRRRVAIKFLEDNAAAIRILQTGKSGPLRHLGRTHKVCIAWLHEQFDNGQFSIEYCKSDHMAADILTKAFSNGEKWRAVRKLIGHVASKGTSAGEKSPSAAAPARALPQCTIVEFCYGPNSLLGQPIKESDGCNVIRLTEEHDVTTPAGLVFAKKAVSVGNCLLWASMPCTGGSPWFNINAKRPGGLRPLRQHVMKFNLIWKAFVSTAKMCLQHGGMICIEWPTNCRYWRLHKVEQFLAAHSLARVNVHGCVLGLASLAHGMPIKKPWSLATNCKAVASAFEPYKCPGKPEHN